MTDIENILITLQLIPDVSAFDQNLMLGERRYLVTQISNDLNAIRELELLVIEKVGRFEYGQALMNAMSVSLYVPMATIATADASTRSAAMIAALEGE